MSSLTKDVRLVAAILIVSNLRARPSTDLSTPLASFLVHQPHEHIVLRTSRLMRRRYNGVTNRLIIPVPPVLLHLRKSLLNHRSDKFNFLLNLGGNIRYHAKNNAKSVFSDRKQGYNRRGDCARLQRLRKQVENHGRFEDTFPEGQIQSQIVIVPALQKISTGHCRDRRTGK
jgi:hypothetical protein